ncbi:hypothetical protein HPB47_021912 [Ixodes persulcatus]|uniref:Uncharacterized protein n=1 Tax=Ixodes persulcatus TaxID=34615 RepID=A0AC60QC92_IXOPE|nr:hypothetical protein HPB47_021912 [Ixodes persulcatus]
MEARGATSTKHDSVMSMYMQDDDDMGCCNWGGWQSDSLKSRFREGGLGGTFGRKKAEFLLRYPAGTRPVVLLLQEAQVPNLSLPGYDTYTRPTIPHRQRTPNGSGGKAPPHSVNYRGNAAVLVAARIPHDELDLQRYVTIDWSWVEDLRKMHPDALVVISGDFNTRHTYWGSRTDTYHGSNLVCATEDNHLSLLNDPYLPTRVGQHARQGDTRTDLTWTNRADTWGSDHLPIFIRLRGHKISTPKRTTSFVCWDAFRAEPEQTPATTSGGDPETHELAHLLRTIHEAKRSFTQQFQVAEDKPSPDLHLASLWQQRLDALCAFNGNMSGPRIWYIFRNWQGKAKRRSAAQTAALRMRILEEQLALLAGAVFFPHPAASPDPTIYSRDSAAPTQMIGDFQALDLQAPEQVDMDQPFQMAELHAALARANAGSALGPDLITISELRNLPELHLQLLLDAINEIWTTGNFPSSWRESLVIPIPKPGKPPNELTNLRPISLTSNLCKLTERMVLERLMWHLARNSPLHPHQLLFRHGMSTQDILLMFRHQVLDAYSKVQTRTVVAALLALRDRLSSSTAGLSKLEELRVSPSLDVRPADAHSPPPWAAPVTLTDEKPLPRNMGPGPGNSERRKRFAKEHTRSVAHKSPPTHTIIYTDMAETLLSAAGDDGEGEDRTPKHVQAVAWVDTTHGIPNAAALSTTEHVDTTQAELIFIFIFILIFSDPPTA